jgi:hypothetical protein
VKKRIEMEQKPLTFEEVVNECYANDEFVKEYNRLTQSQIKSRKSPLEEMIDEATGRNSEEIKRFIEFVDEFVWRPTVLDSVKRTLKE